MTFPTRLHQYFDITLPLSEIVIKIRPFKHYERLVLLTAITSKDINTINNAIKDLLSNCIKNDVNINNFNTLDIEYIVLKLYSISVNNVIDIEHICPMCQHKTKLKINIDNDIKFIKNNVDNIIKFDDTLGVVMQELSYLNHKKSLEIEDELIQNKFIVKHHIKSVFTGTENYEMKDLDNFNNLDNLLESLTDADFNKIYKYIENPSVLKYQYKFNCKSEECKEIGHMNEIILQGLNDFLA